jgi:hypothetical protein
MAEIEAERLEAAAWKPGTERVRRYLAAILIDDRTPRLGTTNRGAGSRPRRFSEIDIVV